MTTHFRRILFLLVLLISATVSAQQKKTVASGYITFNSGSNFEFKELVIEGENVSYFNEVTQNRMNFKLNAVKKIVDNTGATVYDAVTTKVSKETVATQKPQVAAIPKSDEEKLVYQSSARILMDGQRLNRHELDGLLKVNADIYDTYKRGRSDATTGTLLVAGGTGLLVFGVINNLSKAESNSSSGGTPVPLIAGLVAAGIGIPVRISGVHKLRAAVNQYNALPSKQAVSVYKPEFTFVAGAGTVGMQVRF